MDVDQLTPHLEKKKYCIRCRLCRKQLIVSDKIKFSHSGNAEPCGNCIFLDKEFLPDWIKDEIENSSWTKGRLKCPRVNCTARVGGFDFIQGLLCSCGEFSIPAIWIQDGKVDVRTINSDEVTSKTVPSLMSSDQSCSRAVPVQEEHSRHQFSYEGIGETSKNSAKTPEQHRCINKITQESLCQPIGGALINRETTVLEQSNDVTDTNITSYCWQGRGERYDVGVPQSIHHDNVNNTGTTEIRTGQFSTSTHPTTSMVRQRIKKTNPIEVAVIEQFNIDTTRHVTKPVEIKVGKRTSSNRFNPLLVEEPAIVKPSDHTNPCTAMHEHLICAVCLDYFYKPYKCPCSHVFCESCLRQLYHNRVGNLKCPICRSPVKYIEEADKVREEIRQLQNPAIKQREAFERTTKYRRWPLPPIGPLPFLRRRQTLVPKRDQNLVIFATILLLVVCYTILFILP